MTQDEIIEKLQLKVDMLEGKMKLIAKLADPTPRVGIFGPTQVQMDSVKPHERGAVEILTGNPYKGNPSKVKT